MRKEDKPSRRIEEYEPGATKEEVLAALSRAARTPKPEPQDTKKPQK